MAGFEPAVSSSPSLRDARLRYILLKVGAGGFEPPISCSRSTRVSRLPHAPKTKRPAGVEPALPPWQGSRLPLHHGRIESLVELSKNRAPGGTRTHVAALRVRSPRRWTTSAFVQVGSEGLEPSPTWLRARHAATSTLIPCSCFASRCFSLRAQSARRESNPRRGPYKRPALTTELRASGAEGSRTLTFPLKRRKRCRYATTPIGSRAYAFEPLCSLHRLSPVLSCPRWSRTTAGDVSDRYASVTTPDSREGRSRTDCFVLPRHAGRRSPSSRCIAQ